jgi:hypothetical protein
MGRKPNSAGKTAPGVPFQPGYDPRRGKGPPPGEGGRLKSEVRAACQAAFDEAVPVLRAMATGALPDVSNGDRIKAADVLGRYGGLSYTETDARLDMQPPPSGVVQVVYEIPSNGRLLSERAAALEAFNASQPQTPAPAETAETEPEPEPEPEPPPPTTGAPTSPSPRSRPGSWQSVPGSTTPWSPGVPPPRGWLR